METRPGTEHSSSDHGVIEKMNKGYEETLASLSPNERQKKEQLIGNTFQSLSQKIAARGDFELTPERQAVLRLKLARHFQKHRRKKRTIQPIQIFIISSKQHYYTPHPPVCSIKI